MNSKDIHKKNIVIIYAKDVSSYAMELQSLLKEHVCHKCLISDGAMDENIIDRKNRDFIIVLLSKEIFSQCNIERIHTFYSGLGNEQGDVQKFCPYLIQKFLPSLEEWPQWIENTGNYTPRIFRSPYMIIKDIEEKHRKLIWSNNPLIRIMECTFVGRNQEIGTFQNKYFSSKGYNYKALVVSGREGVGKDVFTRYCLNQMGFSNEFEPYSINLGRTSSIENFILQLNSIERVFSIAELKEKFVGSIEDKVNVAVDLLNEVYDSKDVVFVEDSGACVLPQRELAQWLVDIIESPRLHYTLGLFVKSKFVPRPDLEYDYPNITHINLGPLSTSDRKKLFFLFCRSYIPDVKITDEDANYFVERLYYSSNQLIAVVSEIARVHGNVEYVKEHMNNIIAMGDKKASSILHLYDNKEDYERDEYRNLLCILSKFEYVSFDILRSIIGERYNEILKVIFDLLLYGVVEMFGQSDEFIRLDHYISDYINRNNIKMTLPWRSSFNETMTKMIEEGSENTSEDVSLFLYDIRKQLEKNYRCDIDENYLVPSIVLKVIIDKFNSKHYDDVIILCEKTLDDGYHYYEEIRQEMRYWQCAALCHKKNRKVFDQKVDDIKEVAIKKYLFGLFARCKGEYLVGEKYFKEVIQRAPGMGKAKRDLVMCLMGQNKYSEALPIAKDNYENNRENIYYIQTYFRCLARKQDLTQDDIDILDELIKYVEQIAVGNKQKSILDAMNIDYKAFVYQAPSSQVLEFIHQKEMEHPNSLVIKRIGDDYRFRVNKISEVNSTEMDWSYE